MPSPANVRVIDTSKADDKSLVAGIRAEGLLQNLVVTPVKKKKGSYEVTAGGRRYAALKFLEKAGDIPADYPVDCKVKETNLTSVSLQENFLRAAMHPVDEFKAFSRMIDKEGATIDDLRATFGRPKKDILQRLALGRVTDVVLTAFVKNELDLEDVMAFTVVADKAKQAECYEALKTDRSLYPRAIKCWLLGQSITANSALGKFVGRSAYVKAGGSVSADLFSDEVFFLDSALVTDLANKKLDTAAAELYAKGWKWVEVGFNAIAMVHEFRGGFLDPVYSAKAPSESVSRLQEINAQLVKMDEHYDWDDDLEALCDSLNAELRDLEAQLKPFLGYTSEQKAMSGCFLGIDADGLVVRAGYARREDMDKTEADEDSQSESGDSTDPIEDTGNQISQALNADLGAHRQQAAQATMATNPKLAADLLHYTLCLQILRAGSWAGRSLLNCSFSMQASVSSKDDLGDSKSAHDLMVAYESLKTEWATIEDEAERFTAFCALPKQAKDSLVAYCVGCTLQVSSRRTGAAIEPVIEKLAPPFAAYWRPTKANYFGRLTAPLLLKQMEEIRGEAWAVVFKDKAKKEIVADLQEWFADEVDDERQTWLPPQF
jgi:ParB family chromosome partitioning protein